MISNKKILVLYSVSAFDVSKVFVDALRYIYNLEVDFFETLEDWKANIEKSIGACNSFMVFHSSKDQKDFLSGEIAWLTTRIKNAGQNEIDKLTCVNMDNTIDGDAPPPKIIASAKVSCDSKYYNDSIIGTISKHYSSTKHVDHEEFFKQYILLQYPVVNSESSGLLDEAVGVANLVKENRSISNLNKNDVSINGIRYYHISQKIEHLKENIKSIAANKALEVYRDIVKDFWKDGIMKMARESIFATNIPLAKGSYGRTLAFDLLNAQNHALNKSDGKLNISRVFSYTYEEVYDENTNKSLIYLATIQSMVGVNVYMIENKTFKETCRDINDRGGADFMLIDNEGVYFTKSEKEQVVSTQLITDGEVADIAKTVWRNILDHAESFKISVDIQDEFIDILNIYQGNSTAEEMLNKYKACINRHKGKNSSYREFYGDLRKTKAEIEKSNNSKLIHDAFMLIIKNLPIKVKKFQPVIKFDLTSAAVNNGVRHLLSKFYDGDLLDEMHDRKVDEHFRGMYSDIEELWQHFKRAYDLHSVPQNSKEEREAKFYLLDICLPIRSSSATINKQDRFIGQGSIPLDAFINKIGSFMNELAKNGQDDSKNKRICSIGGAASESLRKLLYGLLDSEEDDVGDAKKGRRK